jgi:hypothetical protein
MPHTCETIPEDGWKHNTMKQIQVAFSKTNEKIKTI